jgi:hypothetical protein
VQQADAKKPNRRFEIVKSEDDDLEIKVYPLAFHVLEKHADAVAMIMQAVGQIESVELKNAIDDKTGGALWMLIAPLAGRQILRLLDDSCVPTLSESYAPPDVVAEAAGKWLALSFLRRGSYARLLNAAEGLIEAATGERPDLNSRLLSLFGSATREGKSTTNGEPTDTHSGDGQSPSSNNEGKLQPS